MYGTGSVASAPPGGGPGRGGDVLGRRRAVDLGAAGVGRTARGAACRAGGARAGLVSRRASCEPGVGGIGVALRRAAAVVSPAAWPIAARAGGPGAGTG